MSDRARVVADLRFLAKGRAAYCFRCPQTATEMQGMSPSEIAVHAEHEAAEWLANILAGSNDGKGWLPSWLWDAWEARE